MYLFPLQVLPFVYSFCYHVLNCSDEFYELLHMHMSYIKSFGRYCISNELLPLDAYSKRESYSPHKGKNYDEGHHDEQ